MRRWERKTIESGSRKPALLIVRAIFHWPGENGECDAVVSKRKIDFQKRFFFRTASEARQNPHSPPTIGRLLEENAISALGKSMGLEKLQGPRRFSLDREKGRLFGAAENSNRTCGATRLARQTNESAEVDQSGVVRSRSCPREKSGRGSPEMIPAGRGIDRGSPIGQTGEQARHVGLDDRFRSIEAKTRDRTRGVASHAGELHDPGRVCGKPTAEFFPNEPGGGVQIARPGVVAKPFPGAEDIRLLGSGKGREIREALEPALVIRNHSRDLGLLEHEFRNHDRVRIVRATPGQVAALAPEPLLEEAAELARIERDLGFSRSRHAFGNDATSR